MNAQALHSTGAAGQTSTGYRSEEIADRGNMFRFGAFQLIPESRTLLRNDAPVELGGRAFDLLMTLLQSRGEIVSKDTIMREVWPTTTVDESNLRFQMTCLRRAILEERDRIKTVPGRGYLFISDDPCRELRADPGAEQPPIVIIDGSPENRELLYRVLASAGVRVESFASVAAFLGGELTATPGRALRIAGVAV
jgi:DNA-binding winged helix-turn-helix (wHTH) protein